LREPERILESNYQNFGWDKSTFLQFKNFELADSREMNATKLGQIYTENSSNTFSSLVSQFNLNTYLEVIKNAFLNLTWIVYLILFQILISVLILFNWKSRQKYFQFLILFGASISFIIYVLSINFHVPERISFSILGLLSLVLLTFSNSIGTSLAIFRFKNLVFILLFCSLFSYPYLTRFNAELTARQNMYEDRNELARNQSLILGSLDSNAVVISGASSLRFDWINPYKKFESIDPKDRALILGWHNLSPVWNQKVNDLGLNSSNIYENLTDNNVYWASKTESEEDNKFFWISKYGSNTQVTKISDLGNSEYSLYKITKSN
jgi:hypothetical protein